MNPDTFERPGAAKLSLAPLGKLSFGLAGLAAAAGAYVIYYGTAWGPWAYSDGVGYIVNARNLVLGRGLGIFRASGEFIRLVSHPPFYSLLLAGLGKSGVDYVVAARWLDILLFAAFLFICAWGFMRLTGSGWLAAAFTGLLLLHPAILLAYLSAMSEPLFLVCLMASLLLLSMYLVEGNGRHLFLGSIAAAGALFTRYPGAALIISGTLGLLVLRRTGWQKRIKDSLIFAALGTLPTAIFEIWSRWELQSRAPRGLKTTIDLIPLVKNLTRQTLNSVWTWKPIPPNVIPNTLIPSSYTRYVAAILAVIILGVVAASLVQTWRSRRVAAAASPALMWRPILMVGLFMLSYMTFFAGAYIVSSPTPDVDPRTLLPLLPSGIMLVCLLAALGMRWADRSRALRAALAIAVASSLVGYAIISQDTVFGMHRTGLGYTSHAWRSSETIKAVAQLPPDLILVTNESAPILLYTDRSAYVVPGLEAGDSQRLSVPFGSSGSDLDQAYRSGRAALVLFDSIDNQLKSGPAAGRGLSGADLTDGLTAIFKGKDGAIYCKCSPLAGAP